MQRKAVILFSGGLDSTTCLAIAKSEGYLLYPLSFDYGQKQLFEVQAATKIAQQLQAVEHKVIKIDYYHGSALTDPTIAVPDFTGNSEIPVTYVHARNTVFLSLALGWAESLGAFDIFIGANVLDYSGYPDCRPEYLRAFEQVANLGTKAGVEGKQFKIHAPLLQLNKAEIIRVGMRLGLDYGMTVSCYRLDLEGRACGKCDSCTYRKKGFLEANVTDPTAYY